MYCYQYTLDDNTKYINDICYNICLMCLDNEESSINKIISIQEYINYKQMIKLCCCNSFFHNNCLELWITSKKCCPICRNQISEKIYQLTRSNSYQWEEAFEIEETPITFPRKALQFIIFITSLNAFYVIMYVLFSNTK
jgi:hypothetical protein